MALTGRGGVTIPDSQLRQERGEPNSVAHVIPLQLVGVQYFDEHGREVRNIAAKMGSDVYLLPQGEQLAAQMRPAATWLAERIKLELASRQSPVPSTDSVDVLPTEEPAHDEDSPPSQ